MKKRYIFAIAVAVILATAVVLVILDSALASFASGVLGAVQGVGLFDMLVTGTFITTRYFKLALVLVAILLGGIVLDMMALSFADVILLLSFGSLLITYFIYFLRKKPKTLLDVMKLLSLLVYLPLPLYFFQPLSAETKDVAILLGQTVFAVTIVLYLCVGERKNAWIFGTVNEKG